MKNLARPGTAQTWARTAQPQARTAPFESVFLILGRKSAINRFQLETNHPPIQNLDFSSDVLVVLSIHKDSGK